ncbi:ribbon-helix-helix protein, CopG family [Paenibacillus sp. LMG 31459]|jgi:uncharacterized protein (DUF1778 family)|uniref:Ribbon-helix-helix protein, CopG family n=1 Tax=Paenibacillus phytohabitans TaxID=2654978 RepID=A0ABX1YTG1_9BACL|nr:MULTISPECIES: ribbon-helix-helix protein, CopG family [Paenibacillus]KHL94583.1 transcriptional regulator [Paenibacillus sp. IHB B 3415]NOU83849.1 ribbon-helix-helix protein, CopG family [Paenibacillus phytohabitans]
MEQQGKASTRAKDKYNAANYDQVKLWVKKGDKERIDAAAKAADMSRNAFILEAVEEKINREGKEPPQE